MVRRQIGFIFLFAALAMVDAGAASPKIAEAVSAEATAAPERAAAPQEKHTLTAGDLVLVRVFQEEDLESTLRIGEDGAIVFPLVGAVHVAGQTPKAAAESLQAALKRGYLRNPQVTLTVMKAFKFRFTILGQVQKPGAYDLPTAERLSLLQAIGLAGGYTPIADPKKILIKRRADGREAVIRLNAKEMASGGANSTYEILPGDVITVGESWF